MIRRLLNNWPYKLAALILAIMLWFYVNAQRNPRASRDFPITVLHVPDRYQLRDATSKVTLQLSGSAAALEDVRLSDISATVDAGSAHTGANRGLPIIVSVVPEYRDRIIIDSKSPGTAALTLEPLANVRRTVHLLFTHAAAPGYTYGPPVVKPVIANVIAPVSQITNIHDLIVDVDARIDESQASDAGPIDGRYQIFARDDAGRLVPGASVVPSEAHVVIPIIRVASVKSTPISPTIIGQPALPAIITGAVVDPPFVTLSGAADDLSKIGVVMTSPIDVSGATSDLRRSTTLITLPGVTASTSRSVTVTVHIGLPNSQNGAKALPATPTKVKVRNINIQ